MSIRYYLDKNDKKKSSTTINQDQIIYNLILSGVL